MQEHNRRNKSSVEETGENSHNKSKQPERPFHLRGTCLFMTDGEQKEQAAPGHDEIKTKAVKHKSLITAAQHLQQDTKI